MALVLFALIAALATDAGPTRAALPKPVRAHIARQAACNHWAGEEAYDKARAREINQAVARLRCDDLDREAVALRRRYRSAPAVLKALTDSRDALW
jgi:hypothetical protein